MKKTTFKKLLSILDYVEIQGVELKDVENAIMKELHKDDIILYDVNLSDVVSYLVKRKFLKDTKRGIDLSPCATIYAKSDANSRIEALAMFECLYQNEEYRNTFHKLLKERIHKVDLYSYFDENSYSLLTQTSYFFQEDDYVRLRREYYEDVTSIMQEYKEHTPLLSVTLCARYLADIVSHEDPRIEYKNQRNPIVAYKNLATIQRIFPRRGVPSDRNETKALQTFYKDTLFHECDHACPICEIDIAHMLIASHIKPFRDCAHIYEAIDHNNGLLLCRNHDYLFDQGYISFDDNGYIIICSELLDKGNLASYAIRKNYRLPEELLTHERKLFLAYHREVIFKK